MQSRLPFIYSVLRATGNINLNLTEIQQLGQDWSSQILVDFVDRLSRNVTSANAGQLEGNQMFYTNDYMVCRTLSVFDLLSTLDDRSIEEVPMFLR